MPESSTRVDLRPSTLTAWAKRIRYGESGVLPVVAGLILLVIIFQVQDSVFLSAGNLTNLLVQGSVFVLLGMAEVWVLILGEIDLSVGYVAGVGAVITAILAARPTTSRGGWPSSPACPPPPAIGAAVGRAGHPPPAALLRGHPGRPAGPGGAAALSGQHGQAPGAPSGSPTTCCSTSPTAT